MIEKSNVLTILQRDEDSGSLHSAGSRVSFSEDVRVSFPTPRSYDHVTRPYNHLLDTWGNKLLLLQSSPPTPVATHSTLSYALTRIWYMRMYFDDGGGGFKKFECKKLLCHVMSALKSWLFQLFEDLCCSIPKSSLQANFLPKVHHLCAPLAKCQQLRQKSVKIAMFETILSSCNKNEWNWDNLQPPQRDGADVEKHAFAPSWACASRI